MARMKRMTPAARSARREARAANPKALRPMIGGELASTQQLEEMMDAPSVELEHGDPSGEVTSNDAESGDEPSDDVSQQSSDDSAAEREGEIVKLAAFALGSGGRARWCGQLACGVKLDLTGTWVRENFRAAFIERVRAAAGEFLAVPIGRAQERPAPCLASDRGDGPEALVPQGTTVILGGSCPAIAYQQGAADYCVAYGAASAVLHAGDHTTAAAIAGVAATALQSGDALGFVRDFVLNSVDGWACRRLKNYDPLIASIDTPVILQVAPHCEL